MKRPAGIKFVCMLALAEAAWIGLSLLLHGHLVVFCMLDCIHGGVAISAGLLISGLAAAAGLEVLELLPWARTVILILAGLFVLDAVVAMWMGATGFTRLGAILFYCDRGIMLLVNGWMLWYLSRPEIKSRFRKPKADWSSLL